MPKSEKFRTSRENLGTTVIRKGSKYDTEGAREASKIMDKDPGYSPTLAEGVGDMFMADNLRSKVRTAKKDDRSKYAKK